MSDVTDMIWSVTVTENTEPQTRISKAQKRRVSFFFFIFLSDNETFLIYQRALLDYFIQGGSK